MNSRSAAGTAQAKSIGQKEKYNAAKLAEYFRDHSLYTAFAPVDEPRVALAVVVENSGFGAEAAAPIARRVLDYLLLGLYPSEEDIALARQGKAGAPVGPQRLAANVPLPTLMSAGMATPTDAAASAAPAASAPAPAPARAPLLLGGPR